MVSLQWFIFYMVWINLEQIPRLAAMELARMGRDRAQGSPGRESTENLLLYISFNLYIYLFSF